MNGSNTIVWLTIHFIALEYHATVHVDCYVQVESDHVDEVSVVRT